MRNNRKISSKRGQNKEIKLKGLKEMRNNGKILFKEDNYRGQVTIFIILAIVIVSAMGLYFTFRGTLTSEKIPSSIEPVYTTFLSCVKGDTSMGISLLESQAGYIDVPEFQPGSSFMPFSSQLDFLGNPVPYWYYVSGNNIQKEQVPSKNDMEKQLGDFIKQKINNCNFDNYYAEGFSVSFKKPEVKVNIGSNSVGVSINMDLNISKGGETVVLKNHKVTVNSNLGMLYGSAKKIYEYEQNTLFLENYTIDALRLYAPVDGVKLTCSPLTWDANKVFKKLQEGVESNIISVRTKGNIIHSTNNKEKYFTQDISVDGNVRFLTSKKWPYSFEVDPSERNVLISKPIGNQAGMGILGFCYVPYHFVYSLKYPVLAQISSGNEIFQFPMAVIIQGNNPRKALNTTAVEIKSPELCTKKNTEMNVSVYDTDLNPIQAEISYQCFETKCDIGKTSSGILTGEFPQCANGFIIAKANGFKEASSQMSTVESGSASIIMDKLYKENINLKVDGENYNGKATISFIFDKGVKTIVYPEQKSINLSEGQYEVQVSVYSNSSITLGATTQQKCLDIPQSGVGGFFGFTKQRCFNIDFPKQIISSSLSGGGKQNYFILDSDLANSKTIEINAESLPIANSIEQLSKNYVLFDKKKLEINFK